SPRFSHLIMHRNGAMPKGALPVAAGPRYQPDFAHKMGNTAPPREGFVMPDAGGGTTVKDARALEPPGAWLAAGVTLALLSMSSGSPLVLIVGLKPITDDLGTIRQVTSLAAALTWIGTGAGGILMGWVADRIGIRRTVIFGATMIALGLAVSAAGSVWALY